jgi:hypothetical protein
MPEIAITGYESSEIAIPAISKLNNPSMLSDISFYMANQI